MKWGEGGGGWLSVHEVGGGGSVFMKWGGGLSVHEVGGGGGGVAQCS